MNLFDFLNMIWSALRGRLLVGGLDFVLVYDALGAVIWALLLFKVFLTEGLNVASGEKTELPKILVKYLFVAAMFAVWPVASDQIFNAISALADICYPDLNTLLTTAGSAMRRMADSQHAERSVLGFISTIVGTIQNFTAGLIFTLIGTLTLFLCYMLIIVNIAGSLTILAMNLVIGPVFFALSFDKDFRQIALHWFSAVLSYLLLMPLYGAAITAAGVIAGAAAPGNLVGVSSTGQVAAQLLGPFMAVGIVFSTNKVVNTLVGGAAGSGLGSSVAGLAGIGASLIPGGAILRATSAAGSAAVSKLSSTAKAAMGRNP
jgi:hypothetical protein